jgi:uncharacterized protein YrzB (UPF0473 family)
VTLQDEDGVEREFEHIATLEDDGSTYVALVPTYESPEELLDSDGELVILKIVRDENGEELLSSIANYGEFDRISEKFEEMLGDEYDFEDETEKE